MHNFTIGTKVICLLFVWIWSRSCCCCVRRCQFIINPKRALLAELKQVGRHLLE